MDGWTISCLHKIHFCDVPDNSGDKGSLTPGGSFALKPKIMTRKAAQVRSGPVHQEEESPPDWGALISAPGPMAPAESLLFWPFFQISTEKLHVSETFPKSPRLRVNDQLSEKQLLSVRTLFFHSDHEWPAADASCGAAAFWAAEAEKMKHLRSYQGGDVNGLCCSNSCQWNIKDYNWRKWLWNQTVLQVIDPHYWNLETLWVCFGIINLFVISLSYLFEIMK